MGWVVARITLALAIAGVLVYRWHQGWLSWPLILMSAFILGLLVVEMFTANRPDQQSEFDADGRLVAPEEVAPEGRIRTSPDG